MTTIADRLLFDPVADVPDYARRLVAGLLHDLQQYVDADLVPEPELAHVMGMDQHVHWRQSVLFLFARLVPCPTCGVGAGHQCKRRTEWSPPTTHGDRTRARHAALREAMSWQEYRVVFVQPTKSKGKTAPETWTYYVDAPDRATAETWARIASTPAADWLRHDLTEMVVDR